MICGSRVKGIGVPAEAYRQPSILNHAKCCGGLTEKSDIAYAVIQLMYPAYARKYLEVLTTKSKLRDDGESGTSKEKAESKRKEKVLSCILNDVFLSLLLLSFLLLKVQLSDTLR
jgi:hypothetical protein